MDDLARLRAVYDRAHWLTVAHVARLLADAAAAAGRTDQLSQCIGGTAGPLRTVLDRICAAHDGVITASRGADTVRARAAMADFIRSTRASMSGAEFDFLRTESVCAMLAPVVPVPVPVPAPAAPVTLDAAGVRRVGLPTHLQKLYELQETVAQRAAEFKNYGEWSEYCQPSWPKQASQQELEYALAWLDSRLSVLQPEWRG